MRGFLAIVGLAAVLTLAGGAAAIITGFPNREVADDLAGELPMVEQPTATAAAEPNQPSVDPTGPESAPTPTPEIQPTPTTDAVAEVALPEVNVEDPELTLHTTGVDRVEEQYSEVYTFEDNITIRWRPGAYPPEYAEGVAQKTREALAESNQKLGTSYDGPVIVLLADQLFDEDCLGCQGYTAADQYWVFILDDGGLAEDEFDALLVHEITHLIAAHKIFLPHDLFFAEGLAMWVMTDDLVDAGYISPVQTTAWIYRAGALPTLDELFEDDYAGRMRKRIYYDAAGAFATFIIDEYGWPAYRKLYTRDSPEFVMDKDWAALEAEFHQYLEQFAGNEVNGVGAEEWWSAAERVIGAYIRFYENPSAVSAAQYHDLVLSRLALNRGMLEEALSYLSSSGLGVQTAQ